MKVHVHKERIHGKSYLNVILSARDKRPILCESQEQKEWLLNWAKELNLDIPMPVTTNEYFK